MIKYICEHPVKVVDDLGNINYMPCGHCETCLRKKVNKAYTLLNQVVYNYKHALFIHPTYNDVSLPRAEFIFKENEIQLVTRCDRVYNQFGETDFILKSFEPSRENIDMIDKYLCKFSHRKNYGKEIGIINYKDIQDFFKRIRTYYKRETKRDADFKQFCVCEYGGNYKRPHYHIIFLTNDSDLIDFLYREENYYIANEEHNKHYSKFWRFGYTEIQRVEKRGNSASYVSSYVTTAGDDSAILHHSQARPCFRHSAGLWSVSVDPFRPHFDRYASLSFEDLCKEDILINGIPQRFIETLPAVNSLYRKLPCTQSFTAHTLTSFLRDCESDDTTQMIENTLNHDKYEWIYNYCEKNFKLHRYADRYKTSYQISYAFIQYVKGFIYRLRAWRNNYVRYFPIDYHSVSRYLQMLDDIELFHVIQFYTELQLETDDVTSYYYVDTHRDTPLALRSSALCRLANQESRFKKLHVNKVYELSTL